MQDPFSGRNSVIRGSVLPGPAEQRHLFDDHGRRLEAFDRLRAAAAQCGLGTDPDFDLFVLPEDAVILLEGIGGEWAALGDAIRHFRGLLPLMSLEDFGFSPESEDALAEGSARLRYIGGGVEAWAFEDETHSVYKFFRPVEAHWTGATFRFRPGAETAFETEATVGSFQALLEKLDAINVIGGMPTELVGVTSEGVLVAKQVLGERLPPGTETSRLLPPELIPWPSRFLRCDRDHPRLGFIRERPWLLADPHDRNVVRASDGSYRIIDLVAAPVPTEIIARFPLLRDWIERARHDPHADVLAPVDDDEL